MTTEVRAIETIYKGYKFRSRLEARWAVFLDTLGVEYQYELEGYETPIGRYLPDFWIPEWQLFIEVKPGIAPSRIPENHGVLATEKHQAFVAGLKKDLFILRGSPWPGEHVIETCWYEAMQFGESLTHVWHEFADCWCCSDYAIVAFYDAVRPDYPCGSYLVGNHAAYCRIRPPLTASGYQTNFASGVGNRVAAAYTAARQARFEFGESGRS